MARSSNNYLHLSTQDLDDILRSAHTQPEYSSHTQKGSTKAYASAMRALHKKIQALQDENVQLSRRLEQLDSELRLSHLRLQEFSISQRYSSREQQMFTRIQQLENENRKLYVANSDLQSRLIFQDSRIDQLERINRSTTINQPSKQEFVDPHPNLADVLGKLEKSNNELHIEVADDKKKLKNLSKEVSSLKESSNVADLHYELEELKKFNQTFKESKNDQQKLLKELKYQIHDWKRNQSVTDKMRGKKAMRQSSVKSLKLKNRHIGAHLLKIPDQILIQQQIKEQERDLDQLNKKYKTLLRKGEADNIQSLTAEINCRSQKLMGLKKSRLDLLREKSQSQEALHQ